MATRTLKDIDLADYKTPNFGDVDPRTGSHVPAGGLQEFKRSISGQSIEGEQEPTMQEVEEIGAISKALGSFSNALKTPGFQRTLAQLGMSLSIPGRASHTLNKAFLEQQTAQQTQGLLQKTLAGKPISAQDVVGVSPEMQQYATTAQLQQQRTEAQTKVAEETLDLQSLSEKNRSSLARAALDQQIVTDKQANAIAEGTLDLNELSVNDAYELGNLNADVRRHGIDTDASTRKYGIDVGASVAYSGQDIDRELGGRRLDIAEDTRVDNLIRSGQEMHLNEMKHAADNYFRQLGLNISTAELDLKKQDLESIVEGRKAQIKAQEAQGKLAEKVEKRLSKEGAHKIKLAWKQFEQQKKRDKQNFDIQGTPESRGTAGAEAEKDVLLFQWGLNQLSGRETKVPPLQKFKQGGEEVAERFNFSTGKFEEIGRSKLDTGVAKNREFRQQMTIFEQLINQVVRDRDVPKPDDINVGPDGSVSVVFNNAADKAVFNAKLNALMQAQVKAGELPADFFALTGGGQAGVIAVPEDQFGFKIGEVRTVEGVPHRYIGNNQWQPER